MGRLTIIIPCLGPVESCEDTLVSALQHRPADCEIVVVHTKPYADPYDLRREVRFLVVSGKPDVCKLVNSGLEVSSGEVVHLLSPDLIVGEGWTDAALRWFESPAIGAVSPWLVSPTGDVTAAGVAYSVGGSRWVVGGSANLVDARHHSIVGPTLRGAFYRRQALAALGGLPRVVGDELADVDLALTLRKIGWKMAIEPCSRLIDHRTAAAASRPAGQAGMEAERLFFRQSANANKLLAYALHSLVVTWGALKYFPRPSMLTNVVGRMLTWLEIGSQAEYHTQIAAAKEQFAASQQEVVEARPRLAVPRKGALPLPAPGLREQRRAA